MYIALVAQIIAVLITAQSPERHTLSVSKTRLGLLTFALIRSDSRSCWAVSNPDEGDRLLPLRDSSPFYVGGFLPRIDAWDINGMMWATVCDADGGGAYVLEYGLHRWDIRSKKPIDLVEEPVYRIDKALVVCDGERTVEAHHLFRPSLFEQEGAVAVLGSCQSSDAFEGSAFTWWGTPSIERMQSHYIDGHLVGMGGDARTAVVSETRCVVVRNLKAHQTLQDAASLSVFMTEDLRQWRMIEGPPSVQFAAHDCIQSGGLLWVFGVSPEREFGRGELWNLDIWSGSWQRQGLEVEIPRDECGSVYLLPGERSPEAAWIAKNGELVRRL